MDYHIDYYKDKEGFLMTGHGSKYSRKMDEAIAALISERTIDAAARKLEITSKTLRRWLAIPEFQEQYREARRQYLSQVLAWIQHGVAAAGTVVLRFVADTSVPHSVRLAAAKCVIDCAQKGLDLAHIEARLSELERAAEKKKKATRVYHKPEHD